MACNAFVLHKAENNLRSLVTATSLFISIITILEMWKQTKEKILNTLSISSLIQQLTWEFKKLPFSYVK